MISVSRNIHALNKKKGQITINIDKSCDRNTSFVLPPISSFPMQHISGQFHEYFSNEPRKSLRFFCALQLHPNLVKKNLSSNTGAMNFFRVHG